MENQLDIKKLFGQRIKELRTNKGLTQEQLAERLDIGQRTLSKIECGKAFVSAKNLSNLLTALDIEIGELFQLEYLQDKEMIKDELINAIKDEKVDVGIMYKIYKAIK